MEKKFIIIMASVILLLSITLGVLLFTGPGINLNLDGVRNISLPEMGNFFAGREDATAPNDVADNIVRNNDFDENRFVWHMRLSSHEPADFASSIAMEWVVAEIYERTEGVINITHFPAGMLGDFAPILQEVMTGTIDIIIGAAPSHVDSRMAILYTPHVVTSYADGMNVWTYGSNFFAILNEVAEDNNLKFMGILPGGLIGIGAVDPFNPATVWDFNVERREILIRWPPLWILQHMKDAMQLRTITIPFADTYSALTGGAVDGWLGGSPELNYSMFRDTIRYFYDFRSIDDSFMIFMNKGIFYSIPENYRRIIFEVMQEASIIAIAEQVERSAYFIQRLEDHGVTVFQPTDVQRRQMQDDMIRRGWPALAEEFGQDVMDRILEDIR